MRRRETTIPLSEPLVRALVGAVSDDVHGTETREICERLNETPQRLGDAFEFVKSQGVLLGFGGVWFHPDRYGEGAELFLGALAEIHRADPGVGAVPPGRAARQAGLEWPRKAALRIAADLVAEGRLKGDADGVRLPGFRPTMNARQELALERVVLALEAPGFSPLGGNALAAAVNLPTGALREVLRAGEYADRVAPLEDGIWFSAARLQEAERLLAQAAAGGTITIGRARTVLGTSRRFAHAILAYLSAHGRAEGSEGEWRIAPPVRTGGPR